MKTTPLSAFVIAAVCTAALSSYALAGGHGHHHGHGGMNPPMMGGDGMMGMGIGRGGMTAAERAFFVNDNKAPVGNQATSPADAPALTNAKQGTTSTNATNPQQGNPFVSVAPGNLLIRSPEPIPIKTVPASPIVTPAGEPAPLNAPAAAQMFKGASSAGSPSGG